MASTSKPKGGSRKVLVCALCFFECTTEDTFAGHLNLKHPRDLFFWCRWCGILFSDRQKYVVHADGKDCLRKYQFNHPCGFDNCNYSTGNPTRFLTHFTRTHKGASFIPCAYCKRSFTIPACLVEHIQLDCCERPPQGSYTRTDSNRADSDHECQDTPTPVVETRKPAPHIQPVVHAPAKSKPSAVPAPSRSKPQSEILASLLKENASKQQKGHPSTDSLVSKRRQKIIETVIYDSDPDDPSYNPAEEQPPKTTGSARTKTTSKTRSKSVKTLLDEKKQADSVANKRKVHSDHVQPVRDHVQPVRDHVQPVRTVTSRRTKSTCSFCRGCGKSFADESLLNQHLESGQCPQKLVFVHSCGFQGCRFSSPDPITYIAHFTLTHTGEQFLPCPSCSRSFSIPSCLVEHIQTVCSDTPRREEVSSSFQSVPSTSAPQKTSVETQDSDSDAESFHMYDDFVSESPPATPETTTNDGNTSLSNITIGAAFSLRDVITSQVQRCLTESSLPTNTTHLHQNVQPETTLIPATSIKTEPVDNNCMYNMSGMSILGDTEETITADRVQAPQVTLPPGMLSTRNSVISSTLPSSMNNRNQNIGEVLIGAGMRVPTVLVPVQVTQSTQAVLPPRNIPIISSTASLNNCNMDLFLNSGLMVPGREISVPQAVAPSNLMANRSLMVPATDNRESVPRRPTGDLKNWLEWSHLVTSLKAVTVMPLLLNGGKLPHFFKCMSPLCIFSTSDKQMFSQHLFLEHGGQVLHCCYCFTTHADSKLVDHMLKYHDKLNFQCSACLYRACSKEHVREHYKSLHAGQDVTIITCEAVTQLSLGPCTDVVLHKTYNCSSNNCDFRTLVKADFEKHWYDRHPESNFFCCGYCNFEATKLETLIQHYTSHGVHDIECDYCSFGSQVINTVVEHICLNHANYKIQMLNRLPAASRVCNSPSVHNVSSTTNNFSIPLRSAGNFQGNSRSDSEVASSTNTESTLRNIFTSNSSLLTPFPVGMNNSLLPPAESNIIISSDVSESIPMLARVKQEPPDEPVEFITGDMSSHPDVPPSNDSNPVLPGSEVNTSQRSSDMNCFDISDLRNIICHVQEQMNVTSDSAASDDRTGRNAVASCQAKKSQVSPLQKSSGAGPSDSQTRTLMAPEKAKQNVVSKHNVTSSIQNNSARMEAEHDKTVQPSAHNVSGERPNESDNNSSPVHSASETVPKGVAGPADKSSETGQISYRCVRCDQRHYNRLLAEEHARNIHHMKDLYKCSRCDFSCPDTKMLKKHSQSFHPGQSVTCLCVAFKSKGVKKGNQGGNYNEKTVSLLNNLQITTDPQDNDSVLERQTRREAEVLEHSLEVTKSHPNHSTAQMEGNVSPSSSTPSKKSSNKTRAVSPRNAPLKEALKCVFCTYSTFEKSHMVTHLYMEMHYFKYLCVYCNFRGRFPMDVINHCTRSHPSQSKDVGTKANVRIETWVEDYIKAQALDHQSNEMLFPSLINDNYEANYCSMCDTRLPSETLLRDHLYGHLQYRPHHCNVCDKAFIAVADVEHHQFHEHKCEPKGSQHKGISILEDWVSSVIARSSHFTENELAVTSQKEINSSACEGVKEVTKPEVPVILDSSESHNMEEMVNKSEPSSKLKIRGMSVEKNDIHFRNPVPPQDGQKQKIISFSPDALHSKHSTQNAKADVPQKSKITVDDDTADSLHIQKGAHSKRSGYENLQSAPSLVPDEREIDSSREKSGDGQGVRVKHKKRKHRSESSDSASSEKVILEVTINKTSRHSESHRSEKSFKENSKKRKLVYDSSDSASSTRESPKDMPTQPKKRKTPENLASSSKTKKLRDLETEIVSGSVSDSETHLHNVPGRELPLASKKTARKSMSKKGVSTLHQVDSDCHKITTFFKATARKSTTKPPVMKRTARKSLPQYFSVKTEPCDMERVYIESDNNKKLYPSSYGCQPRKVDLTNLYIVTRPPGSCVGVRLSAFYLQDLFRRELRVQVVDCRKSIWTYV